MMLLLNIPSKIPKLLMQDQSGKKHYGGSITAVVCIKCTDSANIKYCWKITQVSLLSYTPWCDKIPCLHEVHRVNSIHSNDRYNNN